MKQMLGNFLTLIGLLAVSVSCLAQNGGSSASHPPADSSQPALKMQTLTAALSGEWSLDVKWETNASMPNGLVNTGEETWRAGPGGHTLLEEEHLRSHQGDVFLFGVVWWNSTKKNLQGLECQNLLPQTCDVKGALNDITMSWDGKQFVIDEIETSNTGKKSIWHEVWSDITPISFTQTGESGEPGAPRTRLFTIHAKKISAESRNDTRADHLIENSAEPAPEIQSLAKNLRGKWATTYEFEPGGMSPTGGTGAGEEVWRTGPGDYVLMEEEHISGPIGEVYLVAFHWWDKNTHSLRGMLCNNSVPAACDLNSYSNSSLKWDGKQLIIDMEFPQNGKKMMWHEVWSDISSTSFTQTGDMGDVGGSLRRVVTVRGTKVEGSTK